VDLVKRLKREMDDGKTVGHVAQAMTLVASGKGGAVARE
jgi:hypothetical protein